MNESRVICRRARETPTPAQVLGSTAGMPSDLLLDAARRLGYASLVCAAGFAMGIGLAILFKRLHWFASWRDPKQYLFNAVGLVLSLAVYGVARHARLSRRQFVAIAIAYEILGGLLIALPDQAMLVHQSADAIPGVSWLAVWIAVFGPLNPVRPAVTVLVGIVSATMSPLAMWLATLGGHPWPSSAVIANSIIPNYVVAVFMGIPALGLHRMRRAVIEARDLGSYRLVERLGAGGMGEVWRAAHRMLTRPAAIKLIGSETLAHANGVEVRELIRRFELEAQATASLSSPHTVALYDFGVTEDGSLYYVMELLNGLDLEKMVERFGPQPAARTVHFLLQICDSLEEAHARGLVHRDIKPANVQVSRLGSTCDWVKMLDFGLVKRHRRADADLSRLTIGDETRGTPAFIPPEMATGGPLDGRTDLYAVGCVAYWLLTGRMVFEGRTPYEVVSHHISTPPVPVSERSELPVPAELDRVILDCLAKDPAARPANARELARRLAAIPLDPPWTAEDAERWWRLHLPHEFAPEAETARSPALLTA